MYKKKPGYILTLALTLIFLCVFLVTYIAHKGSIFMPYAQIDIERKQAVMLAESGISIAMSQIVSPKVPKKVTPEDEKQKKPTKQELTQDMLKVILPTLNCWQEIKLTQQIEGIDATIAFCIMCEHGKVDLNAFYDFEKHQFINQDAEKMFKDMFEEIKKIMGDKDLFAAFGQIMKEKKYRFNDPTELLAPSFDLFKDAVFYEPPTKDGQKRPVYLTDLFTVWTGKRSVNPWLLSDSIAAVMGLKRAQVKDIAEKKNKVAQWLKQFKLKNQWQTDWNNVLKPLYGKEFNSIPKSLQPLVNDTFEARIFSILSYATVGRVTQRLLAIVERPEDNSHITIKKIYWL